MAEPRSPATGDDTGLCAAVLWRFGSALVVLAAVGCFPRQEPTERGMPAEQGSVTPVSQVPITSGSASPLETDTFSLLAVQPAHGPASGGQLVTLRGNGFTPEVRVFWGGMELPAAQVLPIDSKRLQVIVPPGAPGRVSISTQIGTDESTRRTLESGYTYDPFEVQPAFGPLEGGNLITIRAVGAQWDASTQVTIDNLPCTIVTATNEEISCQAPAGSLGAKTVRVQTANGESSEVIGGYSYVNGEGTPRSALSGKALAGSLEVSVRSRGDGSAIRGALVLVNRGILRGATDTKGKARLEGTELSGTATVTVLARCFQPITFVAVPVDTVTAYLPPVVSAACGNPADVRPTFGASGGVEFVDGEVIWPESGKEFQRTNWSGIPRPVAPNEDYAAYVFPLSPSHAEEFSLPERFSAVTPERTGQVGLRFSLSSHPNTLTLYALAGIENRNVTPPRFTAYQLGITRGVRVDPGVTTRDVFISMDMQLDQVVSIEVNGPAPTPRGPNRLQTFVSVELPQLGHIILPGAQPRAVYPSSGKFELVGLPALSGPLAGARLVASARAYSGELFGMPRSRSLRVHASFTSEPLVVAEFLEIPELVYPRSNTSWPLDALELDRAQGRITADLSLVEVTTGAGLSTWTFVIPAEVKSFALPELTGIDPELLPLPGPVTIWVYAAKIAAFSYASLRYADIDGSSWEASAANVFHARIAQP